MPAKPISYDPEELATLTLLGHADEARRAAQRLHGWASGMARLSIAAALRRQAGYTAQVRSMTRDAYAALPRYRYTGYASHNPDFSRMLALTNLNDATIVAVIDGFVERLETPENNLQSAAHLALALDGIQPRPWLLGRLAALPPLAAAIDTLFLRAKTVAALAGACWRLGDQAAADALLSGLVAETLTDGNHSQRLPAYLLVIETWEQLGAAERAAALWDGLEREGLSPGLRDSELFAVASARVGAGRAAEARALLQGVRGYDDWGQIKLIETFGRQRLFDDAEEHVRQFDERDSRYRHQALMTIAVAHAVARRYERAWALIDQLHLAEARLAGEPLQAIALAGLRHGDLAEARAALARLAEGWPQLLKPVMDSQARAGDWDGARATALSPDRDSQRASLLRRLAGLLLAAARWREAADAWHQSQREG